MTTKILIMGAGGRDFHNFNVVFRDNSGMKSSHSPRRKSQTSMAGSIRRGWRARSTQTAFPFFPKGTRDLIRQVPLTKSFCLQRRPTPNGDAQSVEVLAAGADFRLMGPKQPPQSEKADRRHLRRPNESGQNPDLPFRHRRTQVDRQVSSPCAIPMPYGKLAQASGGKVCHDG